MTARPIPDRLAQLVAQNKIILFLGSGISVASGIPLWGEIAKELVNEAFASGVISTQEKNDLNEMTPRDIANYLFEHISGPDKARFFVKHFSTNALNSIHLELQSFGFDKIITTNWDCLAEEMTKSHFDEPNPTTPWRNTHNSSFTQEDLFQIDMAQRGELDKWILHLHGVYYRLQTIVWSTTQYDAILRQPKIQEFLRTCLRDHAILYVGFGLNDEDHDRLIRDIRMIEPDSREYHYAILPQISSVQAEALRRDKKIIAISYQVNSELPARESHIRGLLNRLVELRNATNAHGHTSESHWGRSGTPTNMAFSRLLQNQITTDITGGISVYGTAGYDFIRDHQESIKKFLIANGSFRLLMIDPLLTVHWDGLDGSASFVDWRHALITGSANSNSGAEQEQHEALKLVKELNEASEAGGGSKISVRYSKSFPVNTICHIGTSIFDCPRPVAQLSLQSPQREYMRGSREFDFYLMQFNLLWERQSRPAPL